MFILELVDGLNRPVTSWYLECSEEELERFVSMLNKNVGNDPCIINNYSFYYHELNY